MNVLLDLLPVSTEPTTAAVITAFAAIITALGGLLLALAVFLPILRATRRVEKQTGVIHTIVNQQRTDAQRYNIALAEVLRKHGIDIPIDQSLPVTGVLDAGSAPVPEKAADAPTTDPAAVKVEIVNPDPVDVIAHPPRDDSPSSMNT